MDETGHHCDLETGNKHLAISDAKNVEDSQSRSPIWVPTVLGNIQPSYQ